VIRAIQSVCTALHQVIWPRRRRSVRPRFDIDLCEKGFERYQSPCNMKYDRGRFGFGTDSDGDIR
jgi:hypothetical protein